MGVTVNRSSFNFFTGTLDYVNSLDGEFTVLVKGKNGLIRMVTHKGSVPFDEVHHEIMERMSYVDANDEFQSLFFFYTKDGEVYTIELTR